MTDRQLEDFVFGGCRLIVALMHEAEEQFPDEPARKPGAVMPRLQRLTDFIARLLGKEWDVRALDQRRSSRPVDSQGRSDEPPTISPYVAGPVGPADSADSTTPTDSSGLSEPARTTPSAQTLDASRSWSSTSGRPEEEPAVGGVSADRSSAWS